jgi:hypothetical protein
LALEAFGTPLAEVGAKAASLLGEQPGRTTGKIFAMLGPVRVARGGLKMAWWGMTGRMAKGG